MLSHTKFKIYFVSVTGREIGGLYNKDDMKSNEELEIDSYDICGNN